MKISICSDRPLIMPSALDRFDYQLDPYIGCEHYCYYCYVHRQAETDWRREIQIYRNIGEQLDKELDEITPQPIYIGYHSDPYQPCEAKYEQTKMILSLLQAHGFAAAILTKSDLVLRDLDILEKMEGASVSVSVAIGNDKTRRFFEKNTVETRKRIKALQKIKEAGVRTGALLCPVIPYVTEAMDLLEDTSKYADTIWIYGLSANHDDHYDKGWKNTRQILYNNFPEIADQVQSAIFSQDHPYWTQLRNDIEKFIRNRQLDLRVHI